MTNKLQELTDKLYNEGLSKGKEEGEQLLAAAKAKAEETMEDAVKKANSIIATAQKQAVDLQKKAESDVKMASAQALQATRKDIENLLVNAVVADKVNAALSDEDFLKSIIKTVAEKFCSSESEDVKLLLPSSMQDKLEPWVSSELKKALGKGVEASFTKKISGGFTIGPKDGSWFVSLTDETFRELISEYLRPITKKLLFGE